MRIGLALIALVSALAAPPPARAAATGFVQVQGEHLMLDGIPWKAIGVNFWDMDARQVLAGDITACWYQHADLDTYFDESFRRIKANTNATAVRTFGFRMMYTAGGTDWSTTDKLIYYARKHNLRLIPVFGDQYGTCGSAPKDPAWYRSGYRTVVEQPWGSDYRSYVIRAVSRYRNDPTIAFWQLMNEATAGADTDALASFSREMVRAIRAEAGDSVHPVNLGTAGGGTAGNELPSWGDLLMCEESFGGCNDLAEAHVFNASDPLPGRPLSSAIDASITLHAASGTTTSAAVRPTIDGWTRLQISAPTSGGPWTRWSLNLATPRSGAWSAMLDDALVQTSSGPQAWTFETGTDGFSSPDATLTTTTAAAHGGISSLRAGVPGSPWPSSVRLDAPVTSGIVSVEAWLRLDFRAARPSTGASIAADLHAATVAAGAPFVLGEAGFQAAVPGLARCAAYRSIAQRATALEEMMAVQLDPLYGSDGALVWDWKDPTIQATAPDGTLVDDPAVDCWTVTPGDPAEAVIKQYADALVAYPPLSAPSPLPSFEHRLQVYRAPADSVGRGLATRFVVRLTHGGNAVAGARIRSGQGCVGSAWTNGLGLADLTCSVTAPPGSQTFTVSVDGATCACAAEPLAFPVTVKRGLEVSASADVAESGEPMPVRIRISDPFGASVDGVRWSVPVCGLDGVAEASGSSAEILAICPPTADWLGSKVLKVRTEGDELTMESEFGFVGLRFERIFLDTSARECIGLAPSIGRVGSTERSGACTSRGRGAFEHWHFYEMSLGERDNSFERAGPFLIASIDAREGHRIDGVFRWEGPKTFAATLVRPDGVHPLASP